MNRGLLSPCPLSCVRLLQQVRPIMSVFLALSGTWHIATLKDKLHLVFPKQDPKVGGASIRKAHTLHKRWGPWLQDYS